eukprot:GDKJ01064252.1.p1 GENE.GDKJ01064252.1~~GDKJ01064252.1.p1  ORF type:complete len:276 (+),score=18.62 GDKJ01064252.1:22-828(+)
MIQQLLPLLLQQCDQVSKSCLDELFIISVLIMLKKGYIATSADVSIEHPKHSNPAVSEDSSKNINLSILPAGWNSAVGLRQAVLRGSKGDLRLILSETTSHYLLIMRNENKDPISKQFEKSTIDSLSLPKKEESMNAALDLEVEKPTGKNSIPESDRSWNTNTRQEGSSVEDRPDGAIFRPEGNYVGPNNPGFFHPQHPDNQYRPGVMGGPTLPGLGIRYDPIGVLGEGEPSPDQMVRPLGPGEMFRRQKQSRDPFPGVGGNMRPGFM